MIRSQYIEFLGPEDQSTTRQQDQRTTGPEDHRTTGPEDRRTKGSQDQRTTGPEDHRTRGPNNQRTTGPEDHRTRGPNNQRTRGPKDQTTRGPQGQGSLNFFSRGCKYFFQGTWIFFPGNVNFFSSIIPLKHITEKHRKTGFWQFLTLTVSPNFFTVWGGYIWVQFFVFVQQFLWILLQERFLLNGFLHIPSCSAPHSMWSQTVTDGPVSFQYNLRPAIHHRGIDDHTTKCRSSILK